MKPRTQSCETPCKNGTYDENGTEQGQHALKIRRYRLPLLGDILGGQTKNRLKIRVIVGHGLVRGPRVSRNAQARGGVVQRRDVSYLLMIATFAFDCRTRPVSCSRCIRKGSPRLPLTTARSTG